MEIEWNEIRARTIMDRWDLSWDLNPGPPQKIDGGDNSSWQTWRFKSEGTYSSGKRKSSKISQRRCISTPDIAISALSQHPCVYRPAVTLLFRSEPLSLPEKLYRHENSNQSPIFSPQRSTVLLGGNWNRWLYSLWLSEWRLLKHLHTWGCHTAASVANSIFCRAEL